MAVPSRVPADPNWPPLATGAAKRFLEAARSLSDRSYWPVLAFSATNLFLWHLDAFARPEDPVPAFADAFGRAAKHLEDLRASQICIDRFPPDAGQGAAAADDQHFEEQVSGLFGDVWVGLSDDIYFEQTFEFTKERFEKSGVDPDDFFGGKVVLDGGCGSGKFSAAIARFGAKSVIGVDIGEKGLNFARQQACRVPYGERIDFLRGSLLDIPLPAGSVDVVWSNGVIHHTLDYEKCVQEFARVLRPGGQLFLYVNGRFGLFEILLDTLRLAMQEVPRNLTQHFLTLLGMNSGRIYWVMDCLYAPYEWKSRDDLLALLNRHGFTNPRQLCRGVATDQIEQVSTGLPFAEVKYGEAQLKFIADRP